MHLTKDVRTGGGRMDQVFSYFLHNQKNLDNNIAISTQRLHLLRSNKRDVHYIV